MEKVQYSFNLDSRYGYSPKPLCLRSHHGNLGLCSIYVVSYMMHVKHQPALCQELSLSLATSETLTVVGTSLVASWYTCCSSTKFLGK